MLVDPHLEYSVFLLFLYIKRPAIVWCPSDSLISPDSIQFCNGCPDHSRSPSDFSEHPPPLDIMEPKQTSLKLIICWFTDEHQLLDSLVDFQVIFPASRRRFSISVYDSFALVDISWQLTFPNEAGIPSSRPLSTLLIICCLLILKRMGKRMQPCLLPAFALKASDTVWLI